MAEPHRLQAPWPRVGWGGGGAGLWAPGGRARDSPGNSVGPKCGWTPVGLQGRLSIEWRQLTLCGPSYTAACLSPGLSYLGSTERRPGWPGWWVQSPEPCPGAWLRMQTHCVILSGRLSPRPVSLPEVVAEAWGWPWLGCWRTAGQQPARERSCWRAACSLDGKWASCDDRYPCLGHLRYEESVLPSRTLCLS